MSDEVNKFAYDLILKAYDHHKSHARFEETQRSWMVTAYLTLTGFVFLGIFSKYPHEAIAGMPGHFLDFWVIALVMHLLIGVLFMVAVSKVSGEFRRHFSRAEAIVHEAAAKITDETAVSLLKASWLETAAIKRSGAKRDLVVLFSNAAVHAYLFSVITAATVCLLVVGFKSVPILSSAPIIAALIWFVVSAWLQHRYINYIESTAKENA